MEERALARKWCDTGLLVDGLSGTLALPVDIRKMADRPIKDPAGTVDRGSPKSISLYPQWADQKAEAPPPDGPIGLFRVDPQPL